MAPRPNDLGVFRFALIPKLLTNTVSPFWSRSAVRAIETIKPMALIDAIARYHEMRRTLLPVSLGANSSNLDTGNLQPDT
jgi:hypothetical protein